MFKLIIGLVILGCIIVIGMDLYKRRKTEEANEDLTQELDEVKTELRKADIKEDVVDAKIKLQEREEHISKKSEVLKDKE